MNHYHQPTVGPELAAALAKAQAEMSNPAFDSQNPHFKSRFASLAAVRNAVIPAFARNGIFVTQQIKRTDGGVACTTVLIHSSGQMLEYPPLEMPLSKPDAQGVGSAATYSRRYSLMAVAGVVGDDDDDANAATGQPAQAEQNHYQHRKEVTAKAKEYAKRFADALDVGLDAAVYEIHQEIVSDDEFYREVWSQLPSGMRREAKERIARAKNGN